MAVENRIEAYNLPLGSSPSSTARSPVPSRACCRRSACAPSSIRGKRGRINECTTEDIVRLLEIDGEEWLFYRAFPIHVAFLRATTADPRGNATMEREALKLDATSAAMAAHTPTASSSFRSSASPSPARSPRSAS